MARAPDWEKLAMAGGSPSPVWPLPTVTPKFATWSLGGNTKYPTYRLSDYFEPSHVITPAAVEAKLVTRRPGVVTQRNVIARVEPGHCRAVFIPYIHHERTNVFVTILIVHTQLRCEVQKVPCGDRVRLAGAQKYGCERILEWFGCAAVLLAEENTNPHGLAWRQVESEQVDIPLVRAILVWNVDVESSRLRDTLLKLQPIRSCRRNDEVELIGPSKGPGIGGVVAADRASAKCWHAPILHARHQRTSAVNALSTMPLSKKCERTRSLTAWFETD